eukprot:10111609-Lingulodinium_polyedra.AAC.1
MVAIAMSSARRLRQAASTALSGLGKRQRVPGSHSESCSRRRAACAASSAAPGAQRRAASA